MSTVAQDNQNVADEQVAEVPKLIAQEQDYQMVLRKGEVAVIELDNLSSESDLS